MSVITACYLIFRSSLDLLQNRTSFQMSVGFVLGFELLSCFKTHPPLSFKVLNCIFSVEQLQNRGTFFFLLFFKAVFHYKVERVNLALGLVQRSHFRVNL